MLKRYEDDGKPANDRLIVSLCAQNALYKHQQALRGVIDNFPVTPVRWLMNWCVFPLGARYRPASDSLGHQVVIARAGAGRGARSPDALHLRLARRQRSDRPARGDAREGRARRGGREESSTAPSATALIRRYHGVDWIGDALKKDVITESEAQLLRDVEALTARVIAVDHFDPAEVQAELHDRRPQCARRRAVGGGGVMRD